MRRGALAGSGTGAAIGLAWATSFRAWMTHLNIDFFEEWPRYTREGTFLSVLLPPVLVGALIGWDRQRRTEGKPRIPLVVWSPLLMILAPALVEDDFIGTLLDTGFGGGAIGIVLIAMCGGFAISGRSPLWVRVLTGLIFLGTTGTMVVGFYLWDRGLSPSGMFGGVYLAVLMAWLAVGFSVPMWRDTPRTSPQHREEDLVAGDRVKGTT